MSNQHNHAYWTMYYICMGNYYISIYISLHMWAWERTKQKQLTDYGQQSSGNLRSSLEWLKSVGGVEISSGDVALHIIRGQVEWDPEQPDLVPNLGVGNPACIKGVGNEWSLRSLPPRAILQFCYSMIIYGLRIIKGDARWPKTVVAAHLERVDSIFPKTVALFSFSLSF